MKKCIVISDSFKGTLSSREICRIASETVPRIFPECDVVAIPVADGGEGTAECFAAALSAEIITVTVSGPFGEPTMAAYARKGDTAVVEMASAAGLPLAGKRKEPENASTYGVGQIIRHAVENGCRSIILGLGGSATNDGGCGCAAALGVKFSDCDGVEFIPTGKTLSRIAKIDKTASERLLKGVDITVMCDVENPLYGKFGAAHVFGPQKGATLEVVEYLDLGLRHLARVFERELGKNVGKIPGAGAAGGMGAGCIAFFDAKLRRGIEVVLDMVGFDDMLKDADLVITGEGRIDGQSMHGKVISGIAGRTRDRKIPLAAIVGCVGDDADEAYDMGVTAIFGIDRSAQAFENIADLSGEYYRRTLEDVLKFYRAVESRFAEK